MANLKLNLDDDDSIDAGPVAPPPSSDSLTSSQGLDTSNPDKDLDLKALLGPMTQKSGNPDLKSMLTTPQDLQQARDRERRDSVMGSIADNLSNRQSFGNYFIGHMAPHVDASAAFRADAANAQQGIADKQTALTQAKEAPGLDVLQASGDAGSDLSKSSAQTLQVGLKAMKSLPGFSNQGDAIDALASSVDGKSKLEIDSMMKENPILKMASDAGSRAALMNFQGAKLANTISNQDRNYGLKQDNQSIAAADKIYKDPILQQYTKVINQGDVDMHTIQNSPIITPQMLHEIGQGVATMLNQGKSVGLGMAEMQDLGTKQTYIASLEQKLTDSPKDGASPEVRQQLVDTIQRIQNAYKSASGAYAQKISTGKNYSHNPQAQQSQSAAVDTYQPEQSSGGIIPSAQASGPQDPNIAAWAKAHNQDYDTASKIIQTRLKGQNGK